MKMYNVSRSAIDEYQRTGVTILRGVLEPLKVDLLRNAIERDMANPGPFYHGYEPENGRGRFYGNMRTWQNDPTLRDFCLRSSMPALAQQFFGAVGSTCSMTKFS